MNSSTAVSDYKPESLVYGIWHKRWQVFRRHKLAYWSLCLFSMIFVLSMFAELIANDKPLVLSYKGEIYFPVFIDYSEKTFGGDFDSEADYRDPFIQNIINDDGWMVWALIRFSGTSINYDLTQPVPSPPTKDNLLGTDDQGRDVLARIIYGLRISILFSLILTLGSSVIGCIVGSLQGYYGGLTDLIGQRFIEVWSGLPVLFLLIMLASLIQPGFWLLLGLMLLFSWTALVDLVRAEFLRGRNFDYVRAAQALGQTDRYIIFRHLLPNAMVSTLTFIPFLVTAGITALTSLDFLGYGLPIGTPSLGELLAQAKANLHAPWLAISAFSSLTILLTLLVLIGEGVRNSFDREK